MNQVNTKPKQTEIILRHLKKGPLSSMEAFQMYGITRLSGRIHELRDQGHDIVTHMVDHTTRFGNNGRHAVYELKK